MTAVSADDTKIALSSIQLERFAAAYCQRWDTRTAAVVSGVPDDQIVEALGSVEVQLAISSSKRMSAELEDAQLARAEEVRAYLWRILDDEDSETQHIIRAADKLLKSYGGYVHRVQLVPPTREPQPRGLSDELADSMRTKVLGSRALKVLDAEATEKKSG